MPMEPMLDTYNQNSALQATCQDEGNQRLAKMAEEYCDNASELKAVRIAEYGCSGGRNSYLPQHTMLSILRRSFPSLSAEFILEDLPSNPWFQVMEEQRRLLDAFPTGVQVLCAGTSFYEQVCADHSVDLGFSYVSAHFMRGAPRISHHVLLHELSASERGPLEAQAARDWETFLALRARELKPGGRLMVSTMSRDGAGYSWKEFSYLVWDCILKAQRTGELSQVEVDALCIPACLRSEAELTAPFDRSASVSTLLQLDGLDFLRTEIPAERDLSRDARASLLRQRVEAVWGGMFLVQLHRLNRTAESASAVMQRVWDDFEDHMRQDPERGWNDMRFFCLTATRKGLPRHSSQKSSEPVSEAVAEGAAHSSD